MKYNFEILLTAIDQYYQKSIFLKKFNVLNSGNYDKRAEEAQKFNYNLQSKDQYNIFRSLSDIADMSAERYKQKYILRDAKNHLKDQWKSEEPYKRIAKITGNNLETVKSNLQSNILKCISNIPVIFMSHFLIEEIKKSKIEGIDHVKSFDFQPGGVCMFNAQNPLPGCIIINMSPSGFDPEIGQIVNTYQIIIHEIRHAIFEYIKLTYPSYSSYIGEEKEATPKKYQSAKDFMQGEEYRTQPTEQFARIEDIKLFFGINDYDSVTAKDLIKAYSKCSANGSRNIKDGFFKDNYYFMYKEKNPNGFIDTTIVGPGADPNEIKRKRSKNPNKDRFFIIDNSNQSLEFVPSENWRKVKSIPGGIWNDDFNQSKKSLLWFLKESAGGTIFLFTSNFIKDKPSLLIKGGDVYVDLIDYEKMARAFNEWASIQNPKKDTATV